MTAYADRHHEDRDYRLTFGKYKGRLLSDSEVPSSYLMAVLGFPQTWESVKERIRQELRARSPRQRIEVPAHLHGLAERIINDHLAELKARARAANLTALHDHLADLHVALLAVLQDPDGPLARQNGEPDLEAVILQHDFDMLFPDEEGGFRDAPRMRPGGPARPASDNPDRARPATALEAARAFLAQLFGADDTACTWAAIVERGEAAGHSEASLRRARKGLLERYRRGRSWAWRTDGPLTPRADIHSRARRRRSS